MTGTGEYWGSLTANAVVYGGLGLWLAGMGLGASLLAAERLFPNRQLAPVDVQAADFRDAPASLLRAPAAAPASPERR